MIKTVLNYLKRNRIVLIFILSLLYSYVLYSIPDNFRLGVIITVFFGIFYYIATNSFFASIFILFFLSSFFLAPAKTYMFEYASAKEYTYELLPEGIFETISINVSDLCGVLLIVYFVYTRIKIFLKSENDSLIKIFNTPTTIGVLFAWFIYFSISLYSSLYYSFSPTFSLNVLTQYGKMVVMFLGILFIEYKTRHRSQLIYILLISVLLFQGVVGGLQFAKNLTSHGANEKTQALDTEQKTDFSRIEGITFHANNHGLIMALLVILTLPFAIINRKSPWWTISFIGAFNILATQSRTVLLGVLFIIFFLFSVRAISFRMMINKTYNKNLRVILFISAIGMLLFILPRIQATGLFFTEDGGWGLRVKMLREGWQLLQQAPWTGFGVSTGVRVFLDKLPNGYIYTFPFPVHITYLQIALESGTPAALAFFFPFYIMLRGWAGVDRERILRRYAGLSIVSSIIMVLVYFTSQPIYGRREFVYLGVIIGLSTIELAKQIAKKIS